MMIERRKPAHEVTPRSEDAGIFKKRIVQVMVDLVPMSAQNGRGDIMIKGYVDGGQAIDVVFPGRRKTQVKLVMALLKAQMARARRHTLQTANQNVDTIRLPVRIEGSWRPRFKRDDQGWETRQYQLMAARWFIKDPNGDVSIYGEPAIT